MSRLEYMIMFACVCIGILYLMLINISNNNKLAEQNAEIIQRIKRLEQHHQIDTLVTKFEIEKR